MIVDWYSLFYKVTAVVEVTIRAAAMVKTTEAFADLWHSILPLTSLAATPFFVAFMLVHCLDQRS
ncbi:hypothetical protein AX15_004688 [Amanita polypyramis BW_CC]|nr:hypothetical protein AX15_004688 [Amanita polypyramis BW_CC]